MPAFKPIQLIPPGLLGFFQLKQEGRGIVELPDVLQGQIELLDWYMQARAASAANLAFVTIGASGRDFFQDFGASTTLLVPQGEFWYVHEYTVSALPSPGAGTACVTHVSCAFAATAADTTPQSFGTPFNNPDPGIAMSASTLCVAVAERFFLAAGAELGFAYGVDVAGGGQVRFDANARITRLPI